MASPASGPHSNRVGQKHDMRQINDQNKGIKKASFLDIITFRGKKIEVDGEKVWVNKASLAKFVLGQLPQNQGQNSHIGFFEHIFVTDKTLDGLSTINTSIDMKDFDPTIFSDGEEELGEGEELSTEQKTALLAQNAIKTAHNAEDSQEAPPEVDQSSKRGSSDVFINTFTYEEVQILIHLGEAISTIKNAGPSEIKRLRERIERETEEVRGRDREARADATASSKAKALEEEKRVQERGPSAKGVISELQQSNLSTSALGFSGERTRSGGFFPKEHTLKLVKSATKLPSGIKEEYRSDFSEKTQPLAKKDTFDLDMRDALTAILNYYVKEFYLQSVDNSHDWEDSSGSKLFEIRIKAFREAVLPFVDLLQIDGKSTLMAEMPQLSKMAAEFFHEFYAFRGFDRQYSQVQMRDFMQKQFQDPSKK